MQSHQRLQPARHWRQAAALLKRKAVQSRQQLRRREPLLAGDPAVGREPAQRPAQRVQRQRDQVMELRRARIAQEQVEMAVLTS